MCVFQMYGRYSESLPVHWTIRLLSGWLRFGDHLSLPKLPRIARMAVHRCERCRIPCIFKICLDRETIWDSWTYSGGLLEPLGLEAHLGALFLRTALLWEKHCTWVTVRLNMLHRRRQNTSGIRLRCGWRDLNC